MNDVSMRKYTYIALVGIAAVLTLMVFWPFTKILIVSIAITSLLFPFYDYLVKKIKIKWAASLLTVLAFVVVLIIPLFIVGTLVFKQSQHLYSWAIDQGGLSNVNEIINHFINRIFPGASVDLEGSVTGLTNRLMSGIGVAFTATASTIFGFILIVLSIFYFLKDGGDWKKTLLRFSPMSQRSAHKVLSKLNTAVSGIIKGYLFIAVVQGILMSIGLYIFGVPHVALWGVVAGIASLIPTIGTSIVSVSSVLYLLSMGHTGPAIGLAIWSAALVGTIDNFLNPIVVGRKIEIHPLIVLFSILGGISLMGPLGILIGPLIISFLYALVSVHKSEV